MRNKLAKEIYDSTVDLVTMGECEMVVEHVFSKVIEKVQRIENPYRRPRDDAFMWDKPFERCREMILEELK